MSHGGQAAAILFSLALPTHSFQGFGDIFVSPKGRKLGGVRFIPLCKK